MTRRVIACNLTADSKLRPRRARAYVLQVSGPRMRILTRGGGHKWVRLWTNRKYLTNFRFKHLPPEHPLFTELPDASGYTQRTLAEWNKPGETSLPEVSP